MVVKCPLPRQYMRSILQISNAVLGDFEIPEQGRVIAHYGAEAQAMIHMEECAELAQAVSKVRRARRESRSDLEEQDNLCGEIADVLISIQQMMVMYDNPPTITDGLRQTRQHRKEKMMAIGMVHMSRLKIWDEYP